ncbi:hypothetical protein KP509_35G053200 [Ceratopteris richardii]|nr:hypothetical protein KP509_35G053200 [Ceratopteris richardii]
MRIRRQAVQTHSSPQGTSAENSSNGTLCTLAAAAEQSDSSIRLHDSLNMDIGIEDLSMIFSASKLRTSVNWLDKLRAAKGFPTCSNDLDVERVISSRACLTKEAQWSCREECDSACVKQDVTLGVDSVGFASNDTGHQSYRVSLNASCQTSPCDIKKSQSCNSGVAEVESLSAHTSREYSFSTLHLTEFSGNNGIIGTETSRKEFVTGVGSNRQNSAKQSVSNVVQPSLPEDGDIKNNLSQVYFDILTDLFCMDSRSTASVPQTLLKKHQRKQEKPKGCSGFGSQDTTRTLDPLGSLPTCKVDTRNTCAIDSDNPTSQSEVVTTVKDVDIPNSPPEAAQVEATFSDSEKGLEKSSEFDSKKKDVKSDEVRKNDLFIIDTSIPGWRTEKIIFKKGNRWRVRSKGGYVPMYGTNSESMRKDAKQQLKGLSSGASEVEAAKAKKQPESENNGKTSQTICDSSIECLNSVDYLPGVWNIAPRTRVRSSRKRRKITPAADEPFNGVSGATCTDSELLRTPSVSSSRPSSSRGLAKHSAAVASDHPASQPKEGLVYSIYQVFMQAGKSGLTPREAVSRILEQGLPGLHEGGVVPRVEVLKIVSNSPYFMPLEESKYILCSALVDDEDSKAHSKQGTPDDVPAGEQKDNSNECNQENSKSVKQYGMSQYWAACAAIRRARTGTTRRKPSFGSYFFHSQLCESHEEISDLTNKKRLKSVKQDVTGLGNPCNRSDGKGWHCPLRAKVGYLLCDHHLDRLRTRVKSQLKSKMLSITKGSRGERKRVLTGSWMVKKVVERSHTGRPSHKSSCFPCIMDEVDNFPLPIATEEVSGGRFCQT